MSIDHSLFQMNSLIRQKEILIEIEGKCSFTSIGTISTDSFDMIVLFSRW